MRTLAILPVKSFAAAKQRLADALGAGSRHALAQAMFRDVLGTLRHVPGLDGIVVVTSDRDAESAARADRVVVLPDTEQAGQSRAALIGIRHALAEGCERVLLVPGDTPLVEPADLIRLLGEDGEPAAARAVRIGDSRDDAGTRDDPAAPTKPGASAVLIVPDRHGTGTNALVLSPPDAIEPSFGPGSFARHMAAAERAGVPHRAEVVRTLALDVDTPADLAELVAELELRRGQAPSTRGALRQLDRAGASPVPQASV
jgi:2-phospho-L-lactate guanylyltransferase